MYIVLYYIRTTGTYFSSIFGVEDGPLQSEQGSFKFPVLNIENEENTWYFLDKWVNFNLCSDTTIYLE